MSTQQLIQHALDAIASARHSLRRLNGVAPDDTELKRALRRLQDAEERLNRALRDAQG